MSSSTPTTALCCAGTNANRPYPGAPHGFMMIREADISRAFAKDSLVALAKATRG